MTKESNENLRSIASAGESGGGGSGARPSGLTSGTDDSDDLSKEELELIITERQNSNQPVCSVLKKLGLNSAKRTKKVLEIFHGVDFIDLKQVKSNPICRDLLTQQTKHQFMMAVISSTKEQVSVAMVEPNNSEAIGFLKSKFKGHRLKLMSCTVDDLMHFIDHEQHN
ncbi:MAG: hypothetical protein K2X27_21095 [Candidatus Obscuribacterales bacterium]|nr:hypothetical protein [Candidatus Obscuribacterales bacterium]